MSFKDRRPRPGEAFYVPSMAAFVPVSAEMLEDTVDVYGIVRRDLLRALGEELHWLLFGERYGRETERIEVGERAALWRDQTSWDEEECCA